MLLLAAPAAAQSVAIEPGGVPDLVGPRTLALSSGIGAAVGNDGIYVNPAALAARRRYAVDGFLLLDRRDGEAAGQFFGSSVVDSSSSAVTAGFSYARSQEGPYTGNMWHLAFAGPIAQNFNVGVTGKFLSLTGADPVRAATVDAGVFWQLAPYLSLGAAGYNLVPIGNEPVAPRAFGAGFAVGTDRSFQLTADWRTDLDRREQAESRYGVGAEYLLFSTVPVRAGFQVDDVLDTRWWSVGAGLVQRNGVALDVGYRRSLDASTAWAVAGSLRVFLFD